MLCMSALLAACGSAAPPDSPSDAARAAEARGEWAAAARLWEAERLLMPQDTKVSLALVRALRLAGDCARAAPHLVALQKADPLNLDVMLESAKCEFVSGRFPAAAEILQAAVKIHPNSSEAETVYGATLDHMNRSAEARRHHDRAVELAPRNAVVLSNKAISVALAGDLAQGLGLMREAARLPGASARVRLNLALLEAVAGNGDVAAALAQDAGDPETVKLLERIAAAAKK